MAIFLPRTASPTFTSLGGMAHCVPESNSVDSMSLPSGKRSPTLMAIAGSPVVWGKAPMIPLAPGYDARMSMAWLPYSVQQRARSAPRINDITTDTERPPQFNKQLSYGGPQVAEQQRKAYPDIQPAVLAAGPEVAFARALAAAQAMGWEIVDAQPKEGRIEATATTFWFGFTDDVVVRITPLPAGSRIDARSKSRVGRGDTGTNAQRVRAYLKRLN